MPRKPAVPAQSKGFGQVFGLDPRIVFLAFVVDTMLFGGEVFSGGLLTVLSMFAAVVLGFITYRAQVKWYGDDHDSALIKACILALLTAIPTNVPAFVYVPSGAIGLVHNFLAKRQLKGPVATEG